MIETAAQRVSPNDPPSLSLVPCADMEMLPPELLTAILEFLDPDDLRRAAAVSRLWNASAWCAGRSLIARIKCYQPWPGSQPAVLEEVVQHAQRIRRQLSLSLTLIHYDNTHWRSFKDIISSLAASLPVLVYLSVSVSAYAIPSFVPALLQPAPHLREFIFLIEQSTGRSGIDVPGDIFGGVAPKLRRLVLDRFPLGQAPVPAFAQVTSLHLTCANIIPDIDYAKHFPCLLDLHLEFHTSTLSAAAPDSFKFGGLQLRRLVVKDFNFRTIIPAVVRSIDVAGIFVFEHICTKLHPDDTLWKQQDLGHISLRVTRGTVHRARFNILVVPAHKRWRRGYHIIHGHDEPCPVSALPGLLCVGQGVTYLRIIDEHLAALLETEWPDLVVLRALRVDCDAYGDREPVGWPPARYTIYGREMPTPERGRRVRCPALETLTLTLAKRNGAMRLETQHIAQLGGALAQCERDARERAALVLVGIQLQPPPADDALLRTAFSSVRFCAPDGSWDPDAGLWEWDEEQGLCRSV